MVTNEMIVNSAIAKDTTHELVNSRLHITTLIAVMFLTFMHNQS